MAEVIDQLPPTKKPARYPWDEWLDGRAWKLTEGEDFNSSARDFSSHVRISAYRRNLVVTIHREGPHLYLQARPREVTTT